MSNWEAGDVWIASVRYPGTCSRCGQEEGRHFTDKLYCFEPPAQPEPVLKTTHRFVITFVVEAEYPDKLNNDQAAEEVEAAATAFVDDALAHYVDGHFESNGIKLTDFVNFTADME